MPEPDEVLAGVRTQVRPRSRRGWSGSAGRWLLAAAVLAGCAPAGTSSGSAARAGSATAASTASSGVPAGTPTTVRQHVTGGVPARCVLRHSGGDPLPDPSCTPGRLDPAVTQATIATTICRSGWTTLIRPFSSETNRVKKVLMSAYGVTGVNELDHLVPLELGGSSDVSNLWPEPGPIPNPKDRIENAVRRAVCAGKVPLALAQHAMAADWTTAERVLGLG